MRVQRHSGASELHSLSSRDFFFFFSFLPPFCDVFNLTINITSDSYNTLDLNHEVFFLFFFATFVCILIRRTLCISNPGLLFNCPYLHQADIKRVCARTQSHTHTRAQKERERERHL